jgi:hypothetical protein
MLKVSAERGAMQSQPLTPPHATSGAHEHLQPQRHRLLRRPAGFTRSRGTGQYEAVDAATP